MMKTPDESVFSIRNLSAYVGNANLQNSITWFREQPPEHLPELPQVHRSEEPSGLPPVLLQELQRELLLQEQACFLSK